MTDNAPDEDPPWLDDDEFEGEIDDDDDERPFDCHMGRDGHCGLAGSEECDFECPVWRDMERAAARRKQLNLEVRTPKTEDKGSTEKSTSTK